MLCTDCGAIVRPIVALDVDGTLANYHHHFLNFASEWLDVSVLIDYDGRVELDQWIGVDKATYRTIKLAYRQGGQKRTMPLMPGAKTFADRIRRCGAEIWITTTRPWMRLDNVDPDTQEWLRRFEIPYDHLIYGEDKFGDLVSLVGKDRVAAVVDDEIGNVLRAKDLELPVIQIATPYNEFARAEIGSVLPLHMAGAWITGRIKEWNHRHDY